MKKLGILCLVAALVAPTPVFAQGTVDVIAGDTAHAPRPPTRANANANANTNTGVVASPSPEKPKPEKSSSALPIALFAGAGAFAGGAVVTGILASGAYRDLKEARARSPADQEKLGDLRRTTKSLALATDILGGSAILLGVVGLYLTLTPSKPKSTAALSPSVKLRLTLTSVGLEGRF